MKLLTFSMKNQATFVCPIMNAETKVSSCMKLRELVWRGVDVPKRKGCQACMRASKCPIVHVVNRVMYRSDDVPDDMGSLEPKRVKLRKEVLERILPIIPLPSILDRSGASGEELERIYSANDRIAEQIKTAPGPSSGVDVMKPARRKKPAADPKPAAPTERAKAAETGDLAAAIS